MPKDPKIKRETDPDYLKWIRSQPCLVDVGCEGDVVPHHDPSVKAGGSDYCAIPLCVKHHIPGVHSLGRKTFQARYGIDFNMERVRLLIGYIRRLKDGT